MPKNELKPGDMVRHTVGFLKAVQWHTDVPFHGMLTRIRCNGRLGYVRWNTEDMDQGIAMGNLEECPTNKGMTDGYRETLMREFGADGVVAYTNEEMG